MAATVLAITSCDRAQREWEQADREGTIASYETFLGRHPRHARAREARERLLELSWERARSTDSIVAYEDFLAAYPDGPRALEAKAAKEGKAEDEAYRKAEAENELVSYLSRYPTGRFGDQARAGILTAMRRQWHAKRRVPAQFRGKVISAEEEIWVRIGERGVNGVVVAGTRMVRGTSEDTRGLYTQEQFSSDQGRLDEQGTLRFPWSGRPASVTLAREGLRLSIDDQPTIALEPDVPAT
jgi:hypothetical protein